MAMIEGFRIQNYGVLKDITLGRLWNQPEHSPLTPLVAVIGKNGSGKSTLFNAFGFLSDALKVGVEEACDLKQRGGFDRLLSKHINDPIQFEIYFREGPQERPITYELSIAKDENNRPYVQSERLRQLEGQLIFGRSFSFLHLENGIGEAWKGFSYGEEESEKVNIELTDNRRLGVATYGVLAEHPRIAIFRNFLEHWYLSYFTPDAARGLPLAGPQKHLSIHGDNLSNVVQYMERDYRDKFQDILNQIASKIPGIDKIDTKRTDDGRLLLRFNDRGSIR